MSIETLRTVPMFARLEDQDLEKIAAAAVVRSFPKSSVVITEGDTSTSLYLILSGEVKVFVSDEDGKANILNQYGAGDYFGELSLIDAEPRSASVATLTACKMSIVSRDFLFDYVSSRPSVAIALLQGMAQRLRYTTDHAKNLALMDVYGRIARVLLNEAREEGGKSITPVLTQKDIADRVGSSREMVCRILKDLRAGDYITQDGKRIIINKTIPMHW